MREWRVVSAASVTVSASAGCGAPWRSGIACTLLAVSTFVCQEKTAEVGETTLRVQLDARVSCGGLEGEVLGVLLVPRGVALFDPEVVEGARLETHKGDGVRSRLSLGITRGHGIRTRSVALRIGEGDEGVACFIRTPGDRGG